MDHSWGRNVVDYGLGDAGCTLAARADVPFAIVVVTNAQPSPGVGLAWIIPPDTAPDDSWFAFGFGMGGLNFPYGFDVEPDVPL